MIHGGVQSDSAFADELEGDGGNESLRLAADPEPVVLRHGTPGRRVGHAAGDRGAFVDLDQRLRYVVLLGQAPQGLTQSLIGARRLRRSR